MADPKNLRDLLLKEEEETKKKKKPIKGSKPDKERFDYTTVDEIVERMKKKYEERGVALEEEPDYIKKATLKDMVAGKRELEIETRDVKELTTSENAIVRQMSKLFVSFGFLKSLPTRLHTLPIAEQLKHDLDSADMKYSVQQYLALTVVGSLVTGLFFFILFSMLFILVFSFPLHIQILLIVSSTLAMVVFGAVIALMLPGSKAKRRANEIEKELPFALMHMATQIRSGVGIHKTLQSVAEAKYGVLSEEIAKTLREIEKGVTTEEALEHMADRTYSENLTRATLHIIRALKTGGNLSEIIELIAKDVSFELRMRMRDFVEKLNLVGLFYMMGGIVFPVFISILAGIFAAVPLLGLSHLATPALLFLIYFVIAPLGLSLMVYIVKVMQPM
jgi:pilus assembly protein TadC